MFFRVVYSSALTVFESRERRCRYVTVDIRVIVSALPFARVSARGQRST
jgi:hypothetical protein